MGRVNESTAAKQSQSWMMAALTLALTTGCFAQDVQIAGTNHFKRTVLVSIPDRKLAVMEDGNVIAKFPVAVGAAISPSPRGEFKIVSRVSNPSYYHPGTVIPAGAGNPLGTRWLGLSQKGYGIHGTNQPWSVGHARSHGCIRLRNRDIERLFAMLHLGDEVQIRGQRDEQVAQVFGSGAEETALAEAQIAAPGGQ
jgi:lipoprotein-anchoring transpeptidase ErfK/SrfK